MTNLSAFLKKIFPLALFLPVMTLVCFLSFTSPAYADGNFSKTCRNIRLENGHNLFAECADTNGQYDKTGANLNGYLENDNGVLRYDFSSSYAPGAFGVYGARKGGRYASSCRSCFLDTNGHVHLVCSCADKSGNFKKAVYDLNVQFKNEFGDLAGPT